MKLTVTDATDLASAQALVRDGKADIALVHQGDGWTLVGKTSIKPALNAYVAEAVRDRTLEANAKAAGTTAAALTAGSTVSPAAPSRHSCSTRTPTRASSWPSA